MPGGRIFYAALKRLKAKAPGKICRRAAEKTRMEAVYVPACPHKLLYYQDNFYGTVIALSCSRECPHAAYGLANRERGDEVMGLFGALTSAVSGLQAQSFAMQNISGNIANSQTIAYKGIDTNFSDLISGSGDASQQVAGGVVSSSVATNSVQGAIQSATTATNMAINGDGYFTVQAPTGFSGTVPIFNGEQNYTRRGDFALNADGYLVNGSGFYLEGIPIDLDHGRSGRQRCHAIELPEQLSAGERDHRSRLCSQSSGDTADDRDQFPYSKLQSSQCRKLHPKSYTCRNRQQQCRRDRHGRTHNHQSERPGSDHRQHH